MNVLFKKIKYGQIFKRNGFTYMKIEPIESGMKTYNAVSSAGIAYHFSDDHYVTPHRRIIELIN